MRRRIKRKRGPVVSKKITVDGIKFASGLEAYMYKALKRAKIKADYEKRTFEILRDLILQMNPMKDKQTVRVVWLIEEIKKF